MTIARYAAVSPVRSGALPARPTRIMEEMREKGDWCRGKCMVHGGSLEMAGPCSGKEPGQGVREDRTFTGSGL